MKKRRVLIAAIAVCLIAILACGSLAYFTFTAPTVTNKFYTYSTDDPKPPVTPKDLFSIEITETGAGQYGENNEYYGKVYQEILPGSTLEKDPTVTNTGKYAAWVRLRITITNGDNWAQISNEIGLTDLGVIFQDFNSNGISEETYNPDLPTGWHRAEGPIINNDTITYVYYSNKPLQPGEASVLFNGMKMPEALTSQHMIDLAQFQIIIEGDAIQSDNTGDSAADAFNDHWTNP